jgi:hypothetical protein
VVAVAGAVQMEAAVLAVLELLFLNTPTHTQSQLVAV